MRKRMLPLLGGLLVVAAIAIAPTAASAGDPQCNNDHYGPNSHWGNGWYGHDGNGSYWRGWGDGNGYFDGQSHDRGCNGNGYGSPVQRPGKVDRVMVAVKRLRSDGRCQHLRRSGRLSHPGSCGPTNWMLAKGTKSWRLPIPRALPAGRYRLHRRAIDAAGNRERARLLHLRIR
jgi:hypothetical protein